MLWHLHWGVLGIQHCTDPTEGNLPSFINQSITTPLPQVNHSGFQGNQHKCEENGPNENPVPSALDHFGVFLPTPGLGQIPVSHPLPPRGGGSRCPNECMVVRGWARPHSVACHQSSEWPTVSHSRVSWYASRPWTVAIPAAPPGAPWQS